jgi:hypothetical protein
MLHLAALSAGQPDGVRLSWGGNLAEPIDSTTVQRPAISLQGAPLRFACLHGGYHLGLAAPAGHAYDEVAVERIHRYTVPTASEKDPLVMALLEAQHIDKSYTIDRRTIPVLVDVSLSVETGAFIVISGSSGSGKTTLLTLLSGLDQPTGGEIAIDGHSITGASEDELAPLRRSTIGFVFQSFHLVPSMTALENVMFPGRACRRQPGRLTCATTSRTCRNGPPWRQSAKPALRRRKTTDCPVPRHDQPPEAAVRRRTHRQSGFGKWPNGLRPDDRTQKCTSGQPGDGDP